MRMRLILVLCGALALTVGVTAAFSATTTVGQTGDPTLTSIYWGGGWQQVADGAVVPAGGGTIVSLNTQSSSCTLGSFFTQGIYNLQVLHPLGGGQYKVLGATGHQTDPCDGQLHSYPVNIPVQAGDLLGVYVVSDWIGALDGGSHSASQQSEPAVGDTFTATSFSGLTIDESATLAQVPTSKSDCTNGGWQTAVDNNGKPFKNQGDCVSYVATKGKNTASG